MTFHDELIKVGWLKELDIVGESVGVSGAWELWCGRRVARQIQDQHHGVEDLPLRILLILDESRVMKSKLSVAVLL